MNHYPTFLRSYNGKSTNSTSNSSSSNNENDENSSIKSLIFKHLSKVQQGSLNNNNNTKGTTRGILGEVGNVTSSNIPITSILTKAKVFQQQQSVATIFGTTSTITAPPPVPPPRSSSSSSTTTIIPIVVDKIENITLDDVYEDDECTCHEPLAKLTKVSLEFDCDSGDSHNITTVSEYIVDICKYWRELEEVTPIRKNFLLNRTEGTASPQNRAVLIDWLYQVHDRFKLLSDTFHMTIQLIDRYLQLIDVSKHELQLIGSTALLLACKYEEMTIPGMNDFVYVSDNAYSKEDMKEMERRVISALSFDLGRPLSINFLRRYSKIVQATDIEHTLGKYLLDLTFIDYSFSHLLPSYVSACASFLSRYLFAYKSLTTTTSTLSLIENIWPSKFMKYHTGYTYEDLCHGIKQLAELLIGQDSTKLRSVQKKFSQSNMFSIAQHSCCKSAYVQVALSRLSK
ncbi:unnamed protein product [Rotaria magnacalcarata]|uniref:Uncharacterized protein n=4 Tax=Rotaria magnacalcarata TaxID=392030 RepID=A0A815W4K6_9BILA|nr:unnamed protein product [Rotaria magnacalcarata]CAF1543249.1 unnamed protein product [Rotaria magnacalcarata]CAF2138650.1 unnamed protein product [Rotaria magnacalcarata]CAF2221345.1 unnamed protein product [Rotaria magnacalcarata]CAF3761814.1 unnamed protein product [Rotaria magnacalcarata]